LKNEHTNFRNTTTNRIESQFGKMKHIVKSQVTLAACVRQLLLFVNSVHAQSNVVNFASHSKISCCCISFTGSTPVMHAPKLQNQLKKQHWAISLFRLMHKIARGTL